MTKIKTAHLILLLGGIILLVPALLKLPAFCTFFSLKDAGSIGDAVGGLTAPFINALGAILVFVAFKEQIKANELLREQQYFQHIGEQIHRLEEDFMQLPKIIENIKSFLRLSEKEGFNISHKGKTVDYYLNEADLNKVMYLTTIFGSTNAVISRLKANRYFLQEKLLMVYIIIYKDHFLTISRELQKLSGLHSKTKDTEETLIEMIEGLDRAMRKSREENKKSGFRPADW